MVSRVLILADLNNLVKEVAAIRNRWKRRAGLKIVCEIQEMITT